jgi:hypothetical protein
VLEFTPNLLANMPPNYLPNHQSWVNFSRGCLPGSIAWPGLGLRTDTLIHARRGLLILLTLTLGKIDASVLQEMYK